MSTIEQRRAHAAKFHGPMSTCTCSHLGDIRMEDFGKPAAVTCMHAGIQGHGACVVPGCDCAKFTWAEYTAAFDAHMAELK